MVPRVSSVVVCLTLLTFTSMIPLATAGGPPCYPQPACQPPTYQCAPQQCGPVPPFALCAGVLNCCRNVCGTIIGIPAAIMGGLLAPPTGPAPWCRPPACPPPACGPVKWAPPMCGPAPCPPPSRITKCRRAAYVPGRTAPLRVGSDASMPPVSYVPAAMYVPSSGRSDSASSIGAFADMPARLISGVFRVANPYGG